MVTEINRVRRLRNSGDRLPPPFPNGWYLAIESRYLKPGQAVSVDLVGKQFTIKLKNCFGLFVFI